MTSPPSQPPQETELNLPPGHPMPEPGKRFPSGCPMNNASTPPVTDKLNELNMIPNLTQQKQSDQTIELPTERTLSSIPKLKGSDDKWEYPSPQQFYNALRRKGWETPEEHVETMVDIHNFLNEEAWNEVLKWESRFNSECKETPYLSHFQGRPQDMSPKARWHTFFGAPKPFDRHDWYINKCGNQRRYVIDYYEAPEEVPGVPVFHLDIRPAVDSPEAAFHRLKQAAQDKWSQWFSSASASTSNS